MHFHTNCIPDTIQNQRLPDAGFSLENAADWASVFVAALAFGLSLYTLIQQRSRDRKARLEAETLRAQTVRLQWYKDLVITPNIIHLSTFYAQLQTLHDQITTPDLTSDQKIGLITHIKQQGKILRSSLIDPILPINENLYDKFIEELDGLSDDLTAAIDNDQLKLNNEAVYNEHIRKRLSKSEKQLFTLIYSYRGE